MILGEKRACESVLHWIRISYREQLKRKILSDLFSSENRTLKG